MQERKLYAIVGYMQNSEQNLIGLLVDFKDAGSVSAACCEALIEVIQCAIEEFGCIESELKVRTTSKELVNFSNKGRFDKLGGQVCYE